MRKTTKGLANSDSLRFSPGYKTVPSPAQTETRLPLLHTTLIFCEGAAGVLEPLIASYMLVLLASLVVVMTVTAALSLLFIREASLRGGEPRSPRCYVRHVSDEVVVGFRSGQRLPSSVGARPDEPGILEK